MNNQNNKQNKYSKLIWSIISVLLGIFTVRMIMQQSDDVSINDLMAVLKSSNKWWLGFGIIGSCLFVWFETIALCSILKNAGYKTKKRKGFIYSTSDIYFSAITPSATGGQPASAFFMIRDGIPGGVVTATLILNLMMYTFSIIVIGTVAVIIEPYAFFDMEMPSKILISIGYVSLFLLSIFFMIILKKGDKVFSLLIRIISYFYKNKSEKKRNKKIKKIKKAQEDYKECSNLISNNPTIMLKALIWNILQRVSQIMVPALLYVSIGGDIGNIFTIFTKQCLVTIGSNFVPIPGGMGISDYLMIEGFKKIMNKTMAYQVEMLSRGITFYICVSISGIITLIGYSVSGMLHKKKSLQSGGKDDWSI